MAESLVAWGVPDLFGGETVLDFLKSLADETPGSAGWDLQEASGAVAGAYNSALATGRDVVVGGDFAAVGDWTEGANWTIGGGNATHAAGAVEVLSQDGIAAAGKTWELTFTVSNVTAGSVTPKLGAAGTARSTNDTFTETIAATSADLDFTPTTDFDGNVDDVVLTQTGILASSAYADPANNPLSGTHTGVTVGQFASGPLGLAVLYDGATSFTDVYSAEMNSVFNPSAFTLVIFAKAADAGVWTDGTARTLVRFGVDAQNLVKIERTTTNNELVFTHRANNVTDVVTKADISTTGYFLIAITIDIGDDKMKAYYNGVQEGSTQATLGAWVGNLSSVTLGAFSTTPVQVWDGLLCHAFYTPAVLTLAQIARIAQLGGVA